jgi:hypothetical protein
MNEWMLGGLVAAGTLVLLGGGSWFANVLRGVKRPDSHKKDT